MPQNDPQNYPILTYIWVIVLSIWGGITHNIRKIRSGDLKRFSFSELIGDITLSGFIGVMTFWLCEYSKIDPMLQAVFIGIASHMGARALFPIEKMFGKWIETFANK